ncbi:MAG: cytochrome c [Candidatus Jettenia sp.]|uniref:Putative cytochrome c n=1 Tax=Candidatus Jettenia caeni TaxID=247490 RepID=I3II05_9BACT|nr:cytochrome c [Candidatus Jettenia sp. AMX1]MBC6930461.1 cytochrome c [Candidatus Jettenia sp.]NUN24643.1 cytochrome c [Candidatus Jettenia caeni]KAA0247138.1 MAG: cytochrome c [Candidatus Jettenia sp. AMX1]MCE7882075.1 cytochrome c [Candidatus Jettenia sp. AMX1]MCQ3928611.1 cytochrome c [Candidatus Jettenia sp.]
MKRHTSFIVIVASIFCTLLFYGCSKQPALSEKGGIWAVYERECQKCHRADGKGGLIGRFIFKIPNFTNTKWQDNASDSRLIISIANGKRKMPGYKGKLKDEEIVDLVKTCVRSFYPPPEQ